MSVAIVIPARFASTRYPGKPLVELTGATGFSRSLIRRSWDAAQSVQGVDQVVVATDDNRIAAHCTEFGAQVVMTPESCANGTERCAAALDQLAPNTDLVVNLQGDAPLTPHWFVENLVAALKNTPDAHVATPVLRCDHKALAGFIEDRRNGRVGGTTAVFDNTNKALYFSKEVLPYTGRDFGADDAIPTFHHVGVYAYRPETLKQYVAWPEGKLERWEGLEQLRFMENGVPVQCVELEAKGQEFWELNNPEDVPRIERILKAQGIE